MELIPRRAKSGAAAHICRRELGMFAASDGPKSLKQVGLRI